MATEAMPFYSKSNFIFQLLLSIVFLDGTLANVLQGFLFCHLYEGCAHLLPEAVAEIGFPALVVFAASLALPAALERLAHAGHGQAHRHGEHADDHAPGLEIGYLGLLLHNFGDGLAIGALGGPHGTAWERNQVALSVAAHTIPITAIFVVAFAAQRSTRAALVRACLLGLAIAAGMAVATLIPESTTRPWEPWITAAIAAMGSSPQRANTYAAKGTVCTTYPVVPSAAAATSVS